MLFNSLHFLIFFPAVVLTYFFVPQRFRWFFLLAVSYYFYMSWNPWYIILLLFSTLTVYISAIGISHTQSHVRRKLYLVFSIIISIGTLFAFKYFNFFSDNFRILFDHFNIFYPIPSFHLLLPVGISFYTFQSLSYSIDVYRGHIKPEKHFGIFALYLAFFPQLVAGPIERSTALLPQFYNHNRANSVAIAGGLKLMLWGFLKKIVIADNASVLVGQVYNNPADWHGLSFIVATVLFAFQIYCDFSGYSDIAIGSAQVLGFRLMDNFKRPYFSKSIAEFWKRWHISLSGWFRDYLYIPLGGNRVRRRRFYFNTVFVFLVSGLWHGAAWTFVIWGLLHGFYIVFGLMTKGVRARLRKFMHIEHRPLLHKCIQLFITFGLVCFSWIFFRANSIADAFYIIRQIFTDWGQVVYGGVRMAGFWNAFTLGFGWYPFLVVIGSIVLMELVHILQRHEGIRTMLSRRPAWIRWGVYYVLILAILFFGNFQSQEFIYFQF